MGNKIARTTQASASEYHLHDLPSSYNLVFKEVLGRGRFFKSILCKHDEGFVLVKVYFKRGDPLDLKEYEKSLAKIREIFRTVQHPHVWPFQFWVETDKAAYLLRQYFFSNLHDRLSTRPFLSLTEKKWLAFQLLCAVKQSHEKDVCHGDIKCENVLVTSWNWLYLADFASFKPTYIPDDDPSDFSFFFDTGGRRRCYLAPERFYDHGCDNQVSPDAPLKKTMDIFSLGCVIAEFFLDGQPLFELSQLLSYRRGQYDPGQTLEKIQDAGIREMILHMIQLDPTSRLSCEDYLQRYTSVAFPSYFSSFLHKFFSCLIHLDSDSRVAATQNAFHEIHNQMTNNALIEDILPAFSINESNQKMENKKHNTRSDNKNTFGRENHLVGDVSSLLKEAEQRNHRSHSTTLPKGQSAKSYSRHQFINDSKDRDKYIPLFRKLLKSDLDSLDDGYNSQTDTYDKPIFLGTECKLSCEGMVLIASLLCSCIRNVKQPQLRRSGVLLLKSSSYYIDDEDRLQHVLPYIIGMLSDPAAIVRCAALESLCDILALVKVFPPSDAKIFPEYILPMLSKLPSDSEESVRICYASNIYKIALTAYRFLLHSQSSTETVTSDKAYSTQLVELRKSIAEVVQELVMGPKQTPNIRRAVLQNIGYLCYFFGQKQCNDFLLPILPAFLNDRDEQLHADFYGQIVFVCYFVGKRSVEEYLLPYIGQALSDNMEAVIVNALDCLSMLCKSNFLRKRILLDIVEKVFPLLSYPIQWVRRAAVTFVAASSKSLGDVDSYVYLYPVVRSYLLRDPASLSSESSIFSCLKPSLSKTVFNQILETARSFDMLDRQRKIWYNSSGNRNQREIVEHNRKFQGIDLSTTKNAGNKEVNVQNGRYATVGNSFNSSNLADMKDSFAADKLQFSGFISPQVSAGNSFICDGPSESIPVYSFCSEKRAAGPDSVMHWNSIGVNSSSMPWSGSANNKSLESSLMPPKLFSGSFYDISNTRAFETFDKGRAQDIVIMSNAAKGSSSLAVDDSSQSDINNQTTVSDIGWKPRGVLVAHLHEHNSAVNDLAVSSDNAFFVSASDDSTVKIWDTRKLEKDISFRSRLTYHLENGRALCTTMLHSTPQVVVGASDGVLHSFNIDYLKQPGNVVEKYSGLSNVEKSDIGEGAILSMLNHPPSDGSNTSHSVLFSTLRSGTHLWDMRVGTKIWNFKAMPEEGYVRSLVMGKCGNWFVSGSSRGVLTLWDLRFLLPVNSWKYSTVCPIEKLCLFIPPANSGSALARPLIYVAAGLNEVSLWNAESGSCHQVFKSASGENEIPRALAKASSKTNMKQDATINSNFKYRIEELNEPEPRLPGIRSLLPLPGGDLLTGGTDLKIRCWDYHSPERCYTVCGPAIKGIGNDERYNIRSNSGVTVVQETYKRPGSGKINQKDLLIAAARDRGGCHRDSILSLASAKLNQRILISSGRDGAVKVWK